MVDTTQHTIESLMLSKRAQNCLERAGIGTVEELLSYSQNDLFRLPWMGKVTVKELVDALSETGLSLSKNSRPSTQLQQSNSTGPLNSSSQPDVRPVLSQESLETSMNGDFAEYFIAAQKNALTERESQIIEMRFGFGEDKAQTLEQIGQRIGVTRERIRQIVVKSLRKILTLGRRQLMGGCLDLPCAELLLFVKQAIRPQEKNAIERLVDFVEIDLAYMPEFQTLWLLAYLAFQIKSSAEQNREEAIKILSARKNKRIEINRDNFKQQLTSDKFQKLLTRVLWPADLKLITKEDMSSFNRMREVSMSGEGNAGVFYSEKMGRHVQYESSMEYDFLQRLEFLDEVMFYQEQPFEVPYEYIGRKKSYYPDVLFVLKDGRGVVVEIKPLFKMVLHLNLRKWSGLKKFSAENGIGLLVTDGKNTIQQIKCHNENQDFSKDILYQLQNKTLSWSDYRKIRDKYKIDHKDFMALVIKNKLIWEWSPFALSNPHDN
jgi:hypothetical protein